MPDFLHRVVVRLQLSGDGRVRVYDQPENGFRRESPGKPTHLDVTEAVVREVRLEGLARRIAAQRISIGGFRAPQIGLVDFARGLQNFGVP